MDPSIGFLTLALLTLLVSLLRGLEIALASLGKIRLTALLKEHPKQRRFIQSLLDAPQLTVSAIGLAADLALITAGVLVVLLAFKLFPAMGQAPKAAIAVSLAALYLIVLGGVLPKYLVRGQMGRWLLRLLGPLYWLTRLFKPFAALSLWIARGIRRPLGLSISEDEALPLEEDQIRYLLEAAEEHGLLDEEEEQMIRKILTYDDLVARQVMVPRPEVVSISVEAPLTEVREIIAREGHSRYPVYEGTRDNIIGILHAKDLLRFGYKEKQKLEECRRRLQEEFPKQLKAIEERAKERRIDPKEDPEYQAVLQAQEGVEEEMHKLRERLNRVTLRDLIRPPYFTPTVKPINDLLRELRRTKQHMAIVVDEFGSMAGIVTLEDILEEIVGEISDEYDQPEKPIRALSPQEFLIEGDAELSLINEQLDLSLPTDGAVTIGGLVTQRLEEIPRPGRSITIEGVKVTVESATAREVLRVRLKLPESAPSAPSSSMRGSSEPR